MTSGETTREFYREQGRKQEQQRIINLFEDNHYKNTWEHYPTKWVYMENCTACNAIAFIKEQNK